MASPANMSACSVVKCGDCIVTKREFYQILRNSDSLLNFFYRHSVLTCHSRCKCGALMNPSVKDRNYLVFRCQKKNPRSKRRCKTCFTILKGSFFEKSCLSLEQVAHLVLLYLNQPLPRYRFISDEMNLAAHTLTDWFASIREVFIFWVDQQSSQIGGQGEVVEIDEAEVEKRKYNSGHLMEGQWIFGGIQKSTGHFFVVPIEDRSSATLLRVIQEKIRPGTTIVSDGWRAYDCLGEAGYHHLTVNHSINFVDPDAGADIQNINRRWVEVRKLIPRVGRNKKGHYLGYLSEVLFMLRYPRHTQRLHHFWATVAQMYPPVTHF